MKTVNVFVCIQMDIDGGEDKSSEVHQVIDLINLSLQRTFELGDNNVQILSNDLDESSIVDQDNDEIAFTY